MTKLPEHDIYAELVVGIPHPSGGQSLVFGIDAVDAYRADPAGFVARHFGVTRDHYLRWVEFVRNPQCCAKTRKGTRCLINVDTRGLERPDRFDPNGEYFCTTHAEHGTVAKR